MALAACVACAQDLHFAVLISANAEWRALRPLFAAAPAQASPYGEYFFAGVQGERVLFSMGDGARWPPPGQRNTSSIASGRRA